MKREDLVSQTRRLIEEGDRIDRNALSQLFHDEAKSAKDIDYTLGKVSQGGNAVTVRAAALLVTADNKSKVYGSANLALTATLSGFVNGDTEASLDTPVTLSTVADATSAVGNYDIVAAGASDANYTVTFVNGTLAGSDSDFTFALDQNSPLVFGGHANPAFQPGRWFDGQLDAVKQRSAIDNMASQKWDFVAIQAFGIGTRHGAALAEPDLDTVGVGAIGTVIGQPQSDHRFIASPDAEARRAAVAAEIDAHRQRRAGGLGQRLRQARGHALQVSIQRQVAVVRAAQGQLQLHRGGTGQAGAQPGRNECCRQAIVAARFEIEAAAQQGFRYRLQRPDGGLHLGVVEPRGQMIGADRTAIGQFAGQLAQRLGQAADAQFDAVQAEHAAGIDRRLGDVQRQAKRQGRRGRATRLGVGQQARHPGLQRRIAEQLVEIGRVAGKGSIDGQVRAVYQPAGGGASKRISSLVTGCTKPSTAACRA